MNDTMFVLWRKASEFDPDRARVSTWLFGIARHAGLKAPEPNAAFQHGLRYSIQVHGLTS